MEVAILKWAAISCADWAGYTELPFYRVTANINRSPSHWNVPFSERLHMLTLVVSCFENQFTSC